MGKTTLGRSIQQASNAVFLDVDRARRELYGTTQRLSGMQEAQAMLASYQANHQRARDAIAQGFPVIIAATYSRQLYHDMLKELAQQTDVPLRVFQLETPLTKIGERIAARNTDPHNQSNVVSPEDFFEIYRRYNPMNGIPIQRIDTTKPIEENVREIVESLADLQID